MFIWILLFILGLFLLVKGSDYLVRGAANMADKLSVSPMIIGLTVLAYGSSLPEFGVSFIASLDGRDGIALGNVIGSNMANICLILGISAMIRPLEVRMVTVKREMLIMVVAVFAMTIMSLDGQIGLADGLILLAGFVGYMIYFVCDALKISTSEGNRERIISWRDAIMVIGGLLASLLGAKFLVDSSVVMARYVGVSEFVIGLTLVAIGTSLPELVTTAVASFRNQSDIAVGNIIGSVSFNTLLVIGACAVLLPLTSPTLVDIMVMLVVCALMPLLFWTGLKLTRLEGLMLLGGYCAYMAYIFA
ncbi:MAG: calcium/sodium antiporter [Methanocellales archaeon]|nr:calcium/sodium antiporter [Methanocellales archaeon]